MPPPLPQQVANPRIREDQALQEIHSKLNKMHRAASDDDFPQEHGLIMADHNVSTYQRSILFNNMGSFNRKSGFRRPENLNKPIVNGEKYKITDLSLLRVFW